MCFWGVVQVEPCCWSAYSVHRDTQATLAILDKLELDGEGLSDEKLAGLYGLEEAYAQGKLTKWQRLRARVWALFDEPYSSAMAKCIAGVSVLFICLSVLSFCSKTNRPRAKQQTAATGQQLQFIDRPHWLFYYLEHACNAWFTLEITLRCIVRFISFSCVCGAFFNKFFFP